MGCGISSGKETHEPSPTTIPAVSARTNESLTVSAVSLSIPAMRSESALQGENGCSQKGGHPTHPAVPIPTGSCSLDLLVRHSLTKEIALTRTVRFCISEEAVVRVFSGTFDTRFCDEIVEFIQLSNRGIVLQHTPITQSSLRIWGETLNLLFSGTDDCSRSFSPAARERRKNSLGQHVLHGVSGSSCSLGSELAEQIVAGTGSNTPYFYKFSSQDQPARTANTQHLVLRLDEIIECLYDRMEEKVENFDTPQTNVDDATVVLDDYIGVASKPASKNVKFRGKPVASTIEKRSKLASFAISEKTKSESESSRISVASSFSASLGQHPGFRARATKVEYDLEAALGEEELWVTAIDELKRSMGMMDRSKKKRMSQTSSVSTGPPSPQIVPAAYGLDIDEVIGIHGKGYLAEEPSAKAIADRIKRGIAKAVINGTSPEEDHTTNSMGFKSVCLRYSEDDQVPDSPCDFVYLSESDDDIDVVGDASNTLMSGGESSPQNGKMYLVPIGPLASKEVSSSYSVHKNYRCLSVIGSDVSTSFTPTYVTKAEFSGLCTMTADFTKKRNAAIRGVFMSSICGVVIAALHVNCDVGNEIISCTAVNTPFSLDQMISTSKKTNQLRKWSEGVLPWLVDVFCSEKATTDKHE